MSEEWQPDEVLREKAREWMIKRHREESGCDENCRFHGDASIEDMAAFAQSILAEARERATEAQKDKSTTQDRKDCSLCGTVRVPLNREGTKRGACTFTGCKDPLYDYNREQALEPK